VEEYLGLKPDAAEMKKLQQQLIEQDKQNAVQIAEMVQVAQRLRSECRFSDAVDTLRRIPQPMQTPEMTSLLNDCDSLAIMRVTAVDAIQRASGHGKPGEWLLHEEFQIGLNGTDLYQATLKKLSLNDQVFTDQYQSFLDAFQQQQDAAQVVQQRQAIKRGTILTIIAASLVLLVVGFAFAGQAPLGFAGAALAAAGLAIAEKMGWL